MRLIIRGLLCLSILQSVATAQNNNIHNPTWWAKYQYLSTNGAIPGGGQAGSLSVGTNVNASNECGPQSETFISLNPNRPKILVGASNEIFRLPPTRVLLQRWWRKLGCDRHASPAPALRYQRHRLCV